MQNEKNCLRTSISSLFMGSYRFSLLWWGCFLKFWGVYNCFGLPRWLSGKELRRCRFDLWVGKISWRRKCQPTLVFLPGKFHGQRSLAQSTGLKRVRLDLATKQQHNCFTVMLSFLLYSKVNQLYVYVYLLFWISFPFKSPRSTEEFALLHSRFSSVIYFTRNINSVCMSVLISQFIPSHCYFLYLASWNITISKRMDGNLVCIYGQTFPLVPTHSRRAGSGWQVRYRKERLVKMNYFFTVWSVHM